MLSKSVSLASRRVASTSRQIPQRAGRRFASGVGEQPASNAASYAVAGAAGGGLVLLGGYTYYHFSGLKTVVNTSQSLHQSVKSAKDQLAEKTPSPSEALKYLRGVAKSYGSLVPGASGYIDSTFDSIDELERTHGDEVNKIVQGATDELKKIIKDGQVDLETAFKVAEVLKRRGEELTKLAAQVGGDIIQPLLDDHPELKDKLSGGWSEFKNLAERSGAPEAKKLAEDTTRQIQDIFKQGFSADSIDKARKLVQEKTEEIKKISDKASGEAWDKAVKAAQPYLDKVPDVKKLIEENASVLASTGAGGSAAAIWEALKKTAGDKGGKLDGDSVNKLKDLVQSKVDEAKKSASDKTGGSGGLGSAWKGMQTFLESAVPGGKEALSQVPDLSSLVKIAQQDGEDAQKLAKETYDDVLKVLKDKSEKAKKLTEGAKEDVGKEAEKSKKK